MCNTSSSFSDVVAVIPAAGIGSRMQAGRPKQYLTIGGKTILEYTVEKLLRHPRIKRTVIALHPDDTYFSSLPIATQPNISLVTGGKERAHSVMAGLEIIDDAHWVLVHDAARPCLVQQDLDALLALTSRSLTGGILAAPVRDTMKQAVIGKTEISHTVDRSYLWHALTPQLFPLELLKLCLQRALSEGAVVTDEASCLEYCGYHPELIPGRADNIKVTRPEDLVLAEFYLMHQKTGE